MDRFYRKQFKTDDLYSFNLKILESDLFIVCDKDLEKEARDSLLEIREKIDSIIRAYPAFKSSLKPLDISESVDPVIKEMLEASRIYNVGPMASIAGAVAFYVGKKMAPFCSYLIIENGGDIFIKSHKPVTLSVYTGEKSPFTGKLKFKIDNIKNFAGVCTSSGNIGHSLSFGKSDAVVVVADSPIIADAAATSLANKVKTPEDIERVINKEKDRRYIKALIITIEGKTGAWGDITFV